MINPCCGGSLQSGARRVVAIEIFTSAAFFVNGIIAVQKYANSTEDVGSLLFGMAYMLCAIAQFILTVYLFKGINQNDMKHCMKWFLGAWVLLLMLIIFAAFETYQGRLTASILWAKPVLLGFTCLLKLYCIWVVFEFINDIRHSHYTAGTKTVMI